MTLEPNSFELPDPLQDQRSSSSKEASHSPTDMSVASSAHRVLSSSGEAENEVLSDPVNHQWKALSTEEHQMLMGTFEYKDPSKPEQRELNVLKAILFLVRKAEFKDVPTENEVHSNGGNTDSSSQTPSTNASEAEQDPSLAALTDLIKDFEEDIKDLKDSPTVQNRSTTTDDLTLSLKEKLISTIEGIIQELKKTPPSIANLISLRENMDEIKTGIDAIRKDLTDRRESLSEEKDEQGRSTFEYLTSQLQMLSLAYNLTHSRMDEKLPSTEGLKDAADLIRLSCSNRELNAKLMKLRKNISDKNSKSIDSKYVKQAAWDLARNSYLTSKLPEIKRVVEKTQKLRETIDSGKENREEDKLTPQEAHLIDSLISEIRVIKAFNDLLDGQNEEIKSLSDEIEKLEHSLKDVSLEHWKKASVFASSQSRENEYRGHTAMLKKLKALLFQIGTGGQENHVGLLYQNPKGELRTSHIVQNYDNSSVNLKRVGSETYQTAYKVRMEGLITNEQSQKMIEEAFGSEWKEEMEKIWNDVQVEFHEEVAKACSKYEREHAEDPLFYNSASRRGQSALGLRRKFWGSDHTEMRDLPVDRREMFCSEFATLALIIMANRFNDKLKAKLILDSPDNLSPEALQKLAEVESATLCRFPLDPRSKLSKFHPHALIEKFGRESKKGPKKRPQVFERLEPSPLFRGMFQIPH